MAGISDDRDSRGSGVSSAENVRAATVRVALPYHLRNLAHVEGDVPLEVPRR